MRHLKTSLLFLLVYLAGLFIYVLQNANKKVVGQRAAEALVETVGDDKGTPQTKKIERTRLNFSDTIPLNRQNSFRVSL